MSRKFNKWSGLTGGALLAALMLGSSAVCAAYAGNVGVDLNIHLGDRPREVIVREPVAPPPERIIVIEDDVQFIFPEGLGFYVAVGVPYDLFYVRNNYYLFRDGRWFRAHGNRGPWLAMPHSDLPPGLRRHRIERVRAYRDTEYDVYRRDREQYRGRHFQTSKEEWKEQRREEKERRKEERREEKEERRHHRGGKHHDD